MSGLFRLTHQRSQKAYRRRQEKERARLKARDEYWEAMSILLAFSWRDPLKVRGELVHTIDSAVVVRKRLKEELGSVPQHIFDKEKHPFGEVLNYRFEGSLQR